MMLDGLLPEGFNLKAINSLASSQGANGAFSDDQTHSYLVYYHLPIFKVFGLLF